MLRTRRAALAAVLVVPVLVGGFVWQDRATTASARLFDQVVMAVGERFVDSLSANQLYEKAARGLVTQLQDPYSELLSPAQLTAFTRNTGGRYAGVGMQIEEQQGSIVVSRVFPNTPAENGGVQEGDRIIFVDTSSTRGWRLQQVSNALLGTPGTRVKVRFGRPGVNEPIAKEFTRAVIHIPAVPYSLVFDGGVGYIPLQQFNETSAEEVAKAIISLKAKGAKSFVLDLRGNGGGYLEQSLEIANYFVPKGRELMSVRGRFDDAQRQVAESDPLVPTAPVAVLIDGYSASASEIVAGALQDHDRAVLLGQTSFGKGLVQSVFQLDGGYALKLTTGKWFTPSGRTIQKDRKVGPDGQFVAEAPDTLAETDSAKKARPQFKSASGRVVYGGGGITPDLSVRPDTFTTAELTVVRAISPKAQEIYVKLYDFALNLKGKVKPDFTVLPEWREEVYKYILESGAKVDRAQLDAGVGYIDRLIENRVARTAFGDGAAKARDLDDDAVLRQAVTLLRKGRSQQELFTLAKVAQSANR
jgi:carboxyl-terminal processing protease